jgi:AraC-like DNA-binding protein
MNCENNKLSVTDVRCFKLERPKNHRFRHRFAPDRARLFLVKQGSVTVRSAHQIVTAVQGEYVSILPGVDTVTEYTGDENCIIMFLFSDLIETDRDEIKTYSRCPEAAVLMETALEYTENTPYRLLAILCGILHHLSQMSGAHRAGDVRSVVRYIENHYQEDRRVSEYADMTYLSESHFRKLFSENTGMSPIEYRNTIRLKIASELIAEGYTVSEAAESVGFNSTSFYCRLAKRQTKFLPK